MNAQQPDPERVKQVEESFIPRFQHLPDEDIHAEMRRYLPGTAEILVLSRMLEERHRAKEKPAQERFDKTYRQAGFGPVPGYDDGNPGTVEQAGWRPLLVTPNHPEFPSAHCTLTSAMAEVFRTFLGTNQINLDIHGFDPAGPSGNLNAVRHFNMSNDLRQEVINARIWAGLHYHFSCVAGMVLGRNVANFDLSHAFQPLE